MSVILDQSQSGAVEKLLKEILEQLKELNKKSPGLTQIFPQVPIDPWPNQPFIDPVIKPYPFGPHDPTYITTCESKVE